MQQSSETIGRIAAALAQAQKELENPEKTLTATIASPFPREGSISFRYASLASGLDLIRKTLGQHEIAAIQRTEIDKELGLIRLNTVLAHSSGEWISSDWPVCQTSEVGAPHRLGAALSYARRYALFALVGIAGEDDLDAPDLPITPASQAKTIDQIKIVAGGQSSKRNKLLSITESQEARDRLIAELEPVSSPDDLTLWALRRLPLKNKLQDCDVEAVELTYRSKLDSVGTSIGQANSTTEAIPSGQPPVPVAETTGADVLKLPKTLRRRNKAHLAFVASQPCLVCQRAPSDPHHLKFAQPKAMGRKVSDEFTVPLCRDHHTQLHAHSNEKIWWADLGIAPLSHARELWNNSLLKGGNAGPMVAPSMP